MDVETARRTDRWLGVPLCLLLTLIRRLRECVAPPAAPAGPRRVLFLKLAEQGSTVLAEAAFEAAAQRCGRENVYLLVLAENRPVVNALGTIQAANVVAVPQAGVLGTLFGLARAVSRLRRLHIDATVDLEFFARSTAVLAYLIGGGRRVGFHSGGGEGPYRGDLLTHRVVFQPRLHTAQSFLSLVEALDLPGHLFPAFPLVPAAPRRAATFRPTPEETQRGRDLLAHAFPGRSLEHVVLLNPNASDLVPQRRWPTDRYVALAGLLLDRFPELLVAFTGAPNEAAAAEALARQVDSERCASVAGRTTFRELLTLYTLARVLVTNDSGPAHFASLTPIRTVVLFGPESPHLFAPLGAGATVLWRAVACSPCLNAYNNRTSTCRNNLCLEQIPEEAVFRAACEHLGTPLESLQAEPADVLHLES